MQTWEPNAEARKAINEIALVEAARSWPCLAALPESLSYKHGYSLPSHKISEIFASVSGYFEAKKRAVDEASFFQRSQVSNEWFATEDSARNSYYKYFWTQFDKHVSEFIALNTSKELKELSKLVNEVWIPSGQLPLTGLANFDPRTAEFVCTRYLLYMGAASAVTTKKSKDSGIDIDSEFYVAQVKHLHAKVGVKSLREFLGASLSTGKIPVFFSKMGYTQDAIEFGIKNKILMYSYLGIFEPCSTYSRIIQLEGMHTKWQDMPWMHSETGWSPGTKEKYGQNRWRDYFFQSFASH
jgi:hypothetical protein